MKPKPVVPMTKERAAAIFYAFNIKELKREQGQVPKETLTQVRGEMFDDFAKFCTSSEETWLFIDYLINDINSSCP